MSQGFDIRLISFGYLVNLASVCYDAVELLSVVLYHGNFIKNNKKWNNDCTWFDAALI